MDMDGVITQTTEIHTEAWKRMFDDFLQNEYGPDFKPLAIEDYKEFIDGISRFDGVRNFLKSRNIELPEGLEDDDSEKKTVYGLGRRKNHIFLKLLEKRGATKYEDALEMIDYWKKKGMKLAVISASRNCKHILNSVGILDLFDARVDGITQKEENLKGKPEPDIFLRACKLLEVSVGQAIVIEDARAGIRAGKKGQFPLVIGVDRYGDGENLKEAGADMVVGNLCELKGQLI
ncbi:haloacid dehalogenase superfamily, subfamily IA, variant 3 with third motif having DD or ED/beta-phosphoglucomutase family hydrolase [Algoriphagus hitonicola]|uniref:Beta-phosphoglucomutase n=2 Tax=Algoriphagus hitonicola TaxID=435880 RepID=A0A1I2SYJ6_9BACT|nr:haloacid dehalogenase superfamily, subfamily IA, variant 3 with third motif having DD or ED/beta-phosphoglucomutase family hydrolase [Algoriphagus hitonicola]